MNKKILFFSFILAIASLFPTFVRSNINQKKQKIYIFGVATCFKDSTIYLTNINALDSATIMPTTKVLLNNNLYNNELKTFIIKEKNYSVYPIITLFYELEKNKLEKEFIKVRKKILHKKDFKLKTISNEKFNFKVDYNLGEK